MTRLKLSLAPLALALAFSSGCSDEANSAPIGDRGVDADGDGRADLLLEVSGSPDGRPWQLAFPSADRFDTNPLEQLFDTGTYANGKAIAAADANGDGRADVLVRLESFDGNIVWNVFLSDVASSSETVEALSLPAGDDARVLAFKDIDDDGLADLLVQQQMAGVLSYYVAFSEMTQFAPPQLIYGFDTAVGRPSIVALEDVNGDGTADLVFDVQSRERHCFYVRAFRNGAFEELPALEDEACWRSEDDLMDVVPAEGGIGQGATTRDTRVVPVGVADVTGDGQSELVISVNTVTESFFRVPNPSPGAINVLYEAPTSATDWLYVSLGEGATGSEWQDDLTVLHVDDGSDGARQRTLALADLDNDGRSDLLYESIRRDVVQWKSRLGTGEERTWLELETPFDLDLRFSTGAGLADFNGDGRLDLLINAPRGNGAPSFAQLYVLLNDGTRFRRPPDEFWVPWYQNMEQEIRIIGLEREGLTSAAHDTSGLLAWAGTSNSMRYTRNEFLEFLAGRGLELRMEGGGMNPDEPLRDKQCELTYPSFDADDLSVNFSTLTCVSEGPFGTQIVQQPVYGGCDIANKGVPGGGVGGAQCEIGFLKQQLKVGIGPIEETLTVEGPNANACGAVSFEFTCAKFGADIASGSVSTKIGDTGVGAGVGIGVGAGGSAGIEDGVISGSLDLKIGIGISIEFSLDYESSGEFVLEHGTVGFVFVVDNTGVVVVSAGEAIIDLVNTLNATGDAVVQGVGEGIRFVGDEIVNIGEEVVDLVDDAIDAVADFFGF